MFILPTASTNSRKHFKIFWRVEVSSYTNSSEFLENLILWDSHFNIKVKNLGEWLYIRTAQMGQPHLCSWGNVQPSDSLWKKKKGCF